jgi:hypothetical protein
MNRKRSGIIISYGMAVIAAVCVALPANSLAWAQPQQAGQAAIAKRIGTIKSISGNTLTLSASGSPDVTVTVLPEARLLRLTPGDKDLKNATPLQLADLHVGDTIRARGQGSSDGNSISALEILVITSTAVSAVADQIRQDWQKRGIGGIVSAVDPAAGTVTLSVPGLTGNKTIVVHTTGNTKIYRYAPDSPRPDDAKLGTLQNVQVNDQLRALGNRNADGSELTAEQIYTGVFLQFDATIKSVDASTGTLSVQDLKSKKTLQLKITADSQLHQIPAEMAQRLAAMLKMSKSGGFPGAGGNSGSAGAGAGAGSGTGAGSGAGAGNSTHTNGAPQTGGSWANGGAGGARPAGGGDLQHRLEQTPTVKLDDLHKGDAIAVLSTEGTPSGGSTVLKLFSGVEPILQAAPSASQAMMLAPWSLGGAPGGEGAQ